MQTLMATQMVSNGSRQPLIQAGSLARRHFGRAFVKAARNTQRNLSAMSAEINRLWNIAASLQRSVDPRCRGAL